MAVKSKNLLGASPQTWVDRMGISEEELENMISQMMRNVGTQTSANMNRIDELNAYGDAPEATRDARLRGAQYQGQMAVQRGTEGAQNYANEANRRAWLAYMQGKISRENAKQGQDAAMWQAIGSTLGSVGKTAGYMYGTGG